VDTVESFASIGCASCGICRERHAVGLESRNETGRSSPRKPSTNLARLAPNPRQSERGTCGFKRFPAVPRPIPPSTGIPPNPAQPRGEPLKKAKKNDGGPKARLFRRWDFKTSAFNRSATPPGGGPRLPRAPPRWWRSRRRRREGRSGERARRPRLGPCGPLRARGSIGTRQSLHWPPSDPRERWPSG
jgi:hypothetical protein